MKRDFLRLRDFSRDEILSLLDRAAALKKARAQREPSAALQGKSVALLFEKSSMRTRVSFEVAAYELGGMAVSLESTATKREPARDIARVLSRYCSAIVVRTFAHETAEEFARYATVPVINGLTDQHHPCQVLAELMTVQQRKGRLDGLHYAWIGDGNNVVTPWIEAAALLGLDLSIATPAGFAPDETVVRWAREHGGRVTVVKSPAEAARGADVLMTDVWASMGQEAERDARLRAFQGYTLDTGLLRQAAPDAIVLHCLPAHRGEEIADEVIEGPQSAVFDEAENRLHTQKALLERLVQ